MDKAENYKRLGLWIWIVFLNCLAALAGEPVQPKGNVPLGSPDFCPSPENPAGWRGDGTGRYPGATPPVHWGRICKQTAALKCAAAVPKDGSTANADSAGLGFFTEWLVAAPIPCADADKAIKEELTPGEAALAPQEGDKLGETSWVRVHTENSHVNILNLLETMDLKQAAYAQACLYTEKPLKIWLHYNGSKGSAFWFNGALKYSMPPGSTPFLKLDLLAGWNRFLFKLTPRVDGHDDFPENCALHCRFWPAEEPREYQEKNIAWIAPMPGLSESTPVIAGGKIFTTAHPYNLVCVEKKSGKILWIRQNSPYDAATEEDRKAKPELFAKLDEMAAKRNAYYDGCLAGKQAPDAEVKAEVDLENEMDKLMLEVNPRYKRPDEQGEPDWWEIPTPASDGKNICLFLTRGVSACYDLDGKRRWIRYERPKHQHHGFFGSPAIADGKLFILDGTVTALDLNDGSVRSSLDLEKTKSWQLAFSSLSRVVMGGNEYILYPDGRTFIRARDGQMFGTAGGCPDATPVFGDNKIFSGGAGVSLLEVKLAADGTVSFQGIKKDGKDVAMKWPDAVPVVPGFYQGHWFEASPLVHEGLGYAVRCWGSLVVFDLSTLDMVYEQVLPLDLFQSVYRREYLGASVTLAGPYIYLTGSTGVTLVVKPGRKYEEIARNRIHRLAPEGRMPGNYSYPMWYEPRCAEYQDCTMTSTPIFEGNRMYFRGMANLYCVEETVWAALAADVSKGEAPLAVKFDGGQSYGMPGRKLVKYAWDFGDGSAASGPSAQHTYQTAGKYAAKLTVTDDAGASDEAETCIAATPPDKTPPVLTAVASKGPAKLLARFSKPLEQAGAEKTANYEIDRGAKITGAELGRDLCTVALTTTPLAEDGPYVLAVKDLKDRARKPNTAAGNLRQTFYRLDSPPGEDGYIRDWLMLPCLQVEKTEEKDALTKEFFAGQQTCAPKDGDKVSVKEKELAWKGFHSDSAVVPAYSGGKGVFLAITYLDAKEDIPGVRLLIGGSHDASRWRLNGQEIIQTQSNRGLGKDQRASDWVTLKKGRNVLALQVVTSWGGRGFCARFLDKNGQPVTNYNVLAVNPPAAAAP